MIIYYKTKKKALGIFEDLIEQFYKTQQYIESWTYY